MKSMHNPFYHRGPIRQRDYFFNRQYEVGQMLGLLQNLQNVALVGPRRIGKTSLLFHLTDPAIQAHHGLSPDEYVFVYLDGEELTELDADHIRRAIAEELVTALQAGGHISALAGIAPALATTSARRCTMPTTTARPGSTSRLMAVMNSTCTLPALLWPWTRKAGRTSATLTTALAT